MKWHSGSKCSIVLGLSLISVSSFSAQTIYGLDQARHFNSKVSNDFYIQMGSYINKSNALRFKSKFQHQASQPILIKEKKGHYLVVLGPFQSADEVRAAAQQFNGVAHTRKIRSEPVVAQRSTDSALIQKEPATKTYKDKDGVQPSNHWFVGLGGGWVDPFGTNTSNFASSGMPGFPNDKYVSNRANNTGQISAFAGYQWRRDVEWIPAASLSFDYTYNFPMKIAGVIFVNNLPDAKNFTFKYDLSQHVPMAKLKLDLYRWQQFMPYVSGGLGMAFNRVNRYSDSPIPGATMMHRRYGFDSATTTQFAGSFGAGLDYWFNYNMQLSLGYELAYYGKARTGFGQGSLSNNRLENTINSNAAVLKGTYFFN